MIKKYPIYTNISRIKDLDIVFYDLFQGRDVDLYYDTTYEKEKQVVYVLRKMYLAGRPKIKGTLRINGKIVSLQID